MSILVTTLACLVAGLVAALVLRKRADGRIALAAGLAALIGNGLQVVFC